MEKKIFIKAGLAMLMAAVAGSAVADDIKAKVKFRGALFNSTARQALHGSFRGNGEYGALDLDAKFTGNVTSTPGTRTPQPRLTGIYPVGLSVRVAYGNASASDSFNTNVEVRRRAIKVDKYGTIRLVRAINPRKKGRQKVSGSGVLKYDF